MGKHGEYIVLNWPRTGTAYGTEEYAVKVALEKVLLEGGTQTVWKRVATVKANPTVTRDE